MPFSAYLDKRKNLDFLLKIKVLLIFASFASDPAGARTQDPIIKSDVLYLLSYGISLLLYQSECKGS